MFIFYRMPYMEPRTPPKKGIHPRPGAASRRRVRGKPPEAPLTASRGTRGTRAERRAERLLAKHLPAPLSHQRRGAAVPVHDRGIGAQGLPDGAESAVRGVHQGGADLPRSWFGGPKGGGLEWL